MAEKVEVGFEVGVGVVGAEALAGASLALGVDAVAVVDEDFHS